MVTKYHRSQIWELGIIPTIEAYIQSVVLKKTLDAISLEHRRSKEDWSDIESAIEESKKRKCMSLSLRLVGLTMLK